MQISGFLPPSWDRLVPYRKNSLNCSTSMRAVYKPICCKSFVDYSTGTCIVVIQVMLKSVQGNATRIFNQRSDLTAKL